MGASLLALAKSIYYHWKGPNTFDLHCNVMGMIDAIAHKIRRPLGPRQVDFYRGDKKCHFMASQLIVDSNGMIVILVTG